MILLVFDKYKLWKEKATEDKDLILELENMSDEAISDAFYKDLEFGTAGLRGVIGAGTNRMNIYTVGKATQGLAAYVNSISENPTMTAVSSLIPLQNTQPKFWRLTVLRFISIVSLPLFRCSPSRLDT